MGDLKSEAIKTDPYIAMRFPEFRSYIAMRFLFTFAYQVQAVVIGWHIYQLTKDPLSLGLIGLAEAIPSIMVTLYGGYIADKSDKKKLLIWIIGSMLCCSAVLTVVTTDHVLSLIGQTPVIIIIYVMIFFIGITRGFYSPTAFALMAQISWRPAVCFQWNNSLFCCNRYISCPCSWMHHIFR
jgi:Na+/melibiose symporter-like transporter